MKDLEIKSLPKGRVIGPEPMKKVMERVLGALLPSDTMDGLVLVAGTDEADVKEALELLQADPDLKMLLWLPREVDLMSPVNLRDLQESSRLKLVKGMVLGDVVSKLLEFKTEAKNDLEGSGNTDFLDPALLRLSMSIKTRVMLTLQQDLKPDVIEEKGEIYARIIAEARQTFTIKDAVSDEQVADFIQQARLHLPDKMCCRVEGVYCGLDDTLLRRDGSVNMEVVAKLEKYAEEGKSVVIWTGGDLEAAQAKLQGTVLEKYEVLSKSEFTGATAEVVIDHVSVEKFYLQYKITPESYVRV